MRILSLFLVFVILYNKCDADTPANCTYEDIVGTWIFQYTQIDGDNTINCTTETNYVSAVKLTLDFPDLAVDQDGNTGFWTLIYNQGFEVVIGGKKWFAFSSYKTYGHTVASMCHLTFPGWVHNTDGRSWNCYVGVKPETTNIDKLGQEHNIQGKSAFRNSESFVNGINSNQSLWKATSYRQFEGMPMEDIIKMAGGKGSANAFPKCAPVEKKHLKVSNLPKQFDWRDQNGVNYVSPVRNQGSCGSCYAFGSMALYEARLRIATNNTVQKVFSTQDIVSCSQYSQGCDGGFPYLIAGKYGQDFGIIEEECFKYTGEDSPCIQTSCKRYYTRDYYYVGGFYGGCNEPLMREELVKNGPIAISFQVYNDFVHYKSGIYHHVDLLDKFNPWEITNHVVLIVGYGEEQGVPYWIVKNSWGTDWGEDGFFRIRRGNDECSIESMAVGIVVDPITS
ncbi:dipeptidyl peptidase 1-like [Ruditapes philippinarum]|uniref:dipeptidyl peptidase 1-like n=1 Tax=Ruditapes philippinarum TaxID=129788 RepID=UPI00295A71D1|nr:dipeptidyl peptidase 1-like [Ruditapes philippinarum]